MNKEVNRGNDGNPTMERVLAARRSLESTRRERGDRRIETEYITEIVMRESAVLRQNAEQESSQQ